MLNDYGFYEVNGEWLHPMPAWLVPSELTGTTTVYEFRLDWRVERELGRRAMRRGRLLALEIECAIREQSF